MSDEIISSGGDVTAPEPGLAADATVVQPPVTLPTMEAPGRYTARFAVVYTVLGIILAGAITGLVVLVIRPGYHPGPSWSTWKPATGNTANVTKEIAAYVSHRYRLTENGGQLVAVIESAPQVTSGTQNISIKAVAVRKAPQSNTGIAIYGADKMRDVTL